MQKEDFIIEDGVLLAYVGKSNIEEMVIPEGVVSAKDFLQQKIEKPIKLTLPASLKSFNCQNDFLKVKELVIPKDSCLEELYVKLSQKEITLPKTIKKLGLYQWYGKDYADIKLVRILSGANVEIISLDNVRYLILPKGINQDTFFQCYDTKYFFYEGTLDEQSRNKLSANGTIWNFIYDNQDIDSIKFYSKNGIDCFKTEKGILVTYINNKKAKLDSLPTTLYDTPVYDFNIYELWDLQCKNGLKGYRRYYNTDSDEKKVIDTLGDLYPRLSYEYKKVFGATQEACSIHERQEKIEDRKKLNNSFMYFNICYWVLSLFASIAIGILYRLGIIKVAGGTLSYIFEHVIIRYLCCFAITFVLEILIIRTYFIISSIKQKHKNVKSVGYDEKTNETTSAPQEKTVDSVLKPFPNYYNASLSYIHQYRFEEKAAERESNEREREYKQLLAETRDIAINGTKEQQAQRALDKKLDEINSAIRESKSSSASSYNVYDDYGTKIGEINKKD